MEFIISKYELIESLKHIKYVIKNNNIFPILKNILFEFKEKKIFISGSDIETNISSYINITEDFNLKFNISANILISIIKILPDINIKFFLKNNILLIDSIKGKYKIGIINSKEYPNIVNIGKTDNKFIISNYNLIKLIDSTLFATGNDHLRPVMNGVYCIFSSKNAIFVATDSYKLVKYNIKSINTKNTFNFILPKRTLQLLKNIISTKKESFLEVSYNESNVQFIFDNKSIICKTINGKYPNYESVIPKIVKHELVIDRLILLDAIKRVSIFSNRKNRNITLSISLNNIKISTKDIEYSNEAYENLNCKYNGENIIIGFDYKILVEVIIHLNTELILMKILESNKPIIFNPIFNESLDENITMLVMPTVIN